MGVVNTKAIAVSNSDRSFVSGQPDIMNALRIAGGKVVSRVGLVAKLTTDSNASVYRFARLPSSARVVSLKSVNDAMTGLTSVTVGVYDTAANGGAAVSAALFATGVSLAAGNTLPIDHRYAVLGAATAEQALWQLLGLASDPGKSYDICITATTAGAAAGNIALEALYVTGEQ